MPLTSSPNWWWQARLCWRTGTFGALMLACLAAAVILRWLPVSVEVPQLRTGGEVTIATTLIIAGALGIALQSSLIEPSPQVHVIGVGLRRWSGQLRVVVLVLIFIGVLAVAAPDHLMPGAVVVLTMSGEAILCGWACGHRLAWLLPGTHAAASALMGATALRGFDWWAWPANPEPTTSAVIVSLFILIAGLAAETGRPRSQLVVHGDDED